MLVEHIQEHRVLKTGSELDSLAVYCAGRTPLQTDNRRTLGGPMRASDRSGARVLGLDYLEIQQQWNGSFAS